MVRYSLVGLAICPVGDRDHFRFDIANNGDDFEAQVTGVANRPSLSIQVLNSSGSMIASGAPVAGTPQVVRAELPSGLAIGTYYVLVQSPDNRIRSYLQINRTEEKQGVKATILELSPRYMLPIGQSFSVGAGPSLTAVHVKGNGVSRTVYGAGLAAGLDWRAGRVYAGVDVRWHDTNERRDVEFDSTAIGLKLGVNF